MAALLVGAIGLMGYTCMDSRTGPSGDGVIAWQGDSCYHDGEWETLVGGGYRAHGTYTSDPSTEDQNHYSHSGYDGEGWQTGSDDTAYGMCFTNKTLPKITITSATATVTAGALQAVSAICPSGQQPTGGGYTVTSSAHPGSVDGSYPDDGKWTVVAHTPDQSQPSFTIEVHALCTADLNTHLESKKLAFASKAAQDSLTCSQGNLLSGGYNIQTAASDEAWVSNNSPDSDSTKDLTDGSLVSAWYLKATMQTAASPTGDLWVVCWDKNGKVVTTPTPTATATATATPRPTVTPTPRTLRCTPYTSGSASMNVDNSYLNLETNTLDHQPTGSQIQWTGPQTNTFVPQNGALLSDIGPGGAAAYNGLTCGQIAGASYSAPLVPAPNNEVFLVKTPAGRYAKVIESFSSGALGPSLQWVTYTVSS